MDQSATRDALGRFSRGHSGNLRGRPFGSRNRPRQQDPASAATWSRAAWRQFYKQALHAAHGDTSAAAFETVALFVASKPPRTGKAGHCAQCGEVLSLIATLPRSSAFPALGSWVHWQCAPYFVQRRFAEAALTLKGMNIAEKWPI